MDPEASVLLHCAPCRGLRQSQVRVELSPRYNRCKEPELESRIASLWTDRVSQQPWLFNGAKFRLHSATLRMHRERGREGGGEGERRRGGEGQIDEGKKVEEVFKGWVEGGAGEGVSESMRQGEGEREGRREGHREREQDREGGGETEEDEKEGAVLTLCLGLTCYRDFLGTNWSEGARGLRARGQAQYGDPLALLAQPLGVGGVVITGDGGVVFLRRSQRVGEAAGLIDIPGGHPEPTVVVPGVGEDSVTLEQLSEEGVLKELFSSILNEIRDEVNIPLQYLSEPLLLGIALNHTSAGRPSAEFFIRCTLSSEKVKELYWQGGPEAHESTNIIIINREEVLQLDESSPLWPELCPSAKGAVLLYRLVQPDKEG
ncbi:uridine diphosphate glucose pyrophosphatase NUDT22 [Amia ocellicauda]|uniref:uridine diphosphate glucose pyrophosphatase NUDT22 n=1 Tax=Amia ocellicauda TaxID=2972642 RepID=UPI0034648A22